MRSALVLPLTAAVAASVALAVSSAQPLPAGSARSRTALPVADSRTSAVTPRAPVAARPTLGGMPQGQLDSPVLPTVSAPRGTAVLRGRWAWPLAPQPDVVRPFVRPATAYGAGHRGIDLAGPSGQEVGAVDAGTVSHVGRLAGRGTVTVLHASGVRSTYEPVEAVVGAGDVVTRESLLGHLEGSGSHCQPTCLHLGALRERVYLDPLVFLTGGRPVRLLPLAQAPDG
jgi:murein DD-endopeptidase MepM/ murein hydrolase activator NlpD